MATRTRDHLGTTMEISPVDDEDLADLIRVQPLFDSSHFSFKLLDHRIAILPTQKNLSIIQCLLVHSFRFRFLIVIKYIFVPPTHSYLSCVFLTQFDG